MKNINMMMMKTKMVSGLLAILIVFAACNDDFLDTQPLDKVASTATWSDGTLSEAFVFSVYSYLGFAGFENCGKLKTREVWFWVFRVLQPASSKLVSVWFWVSQVLKSGANW